GLGLVALLPVANPLASATLLLALSQGYTTKERNRQIDRATLYVAAILLVCFYAGNAIMSGLGISIPGLRIAGGLIVAYLGFGMLLPATTPHGTADKLATAPRQPDLQVQTPRVPIHPTPRVIAIMPLPMPGTAGPSTIALIIIGTTPLRSHGDGMLFLHPQAAITVA